jgi:hypothetical protein
MAIHANKLLHPNAHTKILNVTVTVADEVTVIVTLTLQPELSKKTTVEKSLKKGNNKVGLLKLPPG